MKKKKSKWILLKILLIILIIIVLFIGIMYFLFICDNVDELRKIENKSSFVLVDNMLEYVKGVFILMEDEWFYNYYGFDLKGIIRVLFLMISDRDV